jgi:hypothetical protein
MRATGRLDAFIVRIPKLTVTAAAPPAAAAPARTPLTSGRTPPMAGEAGHVDVARQRHGHGRRAAQDGGCAGCAGRRRRVVDSDRRGRRRARARAGDTQALRAIGLGSGSTGTGPQEIHVRDCGCRTGGWRCGEGRLTGRAGHRGRGRLQVTVRGGTRELLGERCGRSTRARREPVYPLRVDTSLYDVGATLTAVTLARP